jgi:hypothetical protein
MEVHTCECTKGCTFSTALGNEGERITIKKKENVIPNLEQILEEQQQKYQVYIMD